ncbi:hypothetical protein MnTg02_03397 [bacterium MnTg02]|nr:hypothetical protein MnTg02_03397 [bacterium MnTg02]
MKTFMKLLVAVAMIVPLSFASLNKVAYATPDTGSYDPLAAIMAQHFVYQHILKKELTFASVIFDVAAVHPQPEKNYWAVVGGYLTNRQFHNTFVAAIRLVCSDSENPDCWFLQKLAINQKIVLNISDPI